MQTTPYNKWLKHTDCKLQDLDKLVRAESHPDAYPLCDKIQQNIPLYSGATIRQRADDQQYTAALLSEWNHVLEGGAGVIVIKSAYADNTLLDQVTEVLQGIIEAEKCVDDKAGDHFAVAGANSRVWNSHEKLAVANAELFAAYYANPVIHLASHAWLGPGYQITAQVNVVHSGGRAQICHRDYHLGFQSVEQLSAYPLNVQRVSPHLTLQGAIAHSDMTLESGPTKVLPFSQRYTPGYMAVQLAEFREFFEGNFAQLPLDCGDMMYFNPAVFHAAGDNHTAQDRFGNLLQIGSAFGRTTELVDRARLCRLIYPVLLNARNDQAMSDREITDVIAATAEGYSFPCNLDLTPPVDGLAPVSQQQLMSDHLAAGSTTMVFCDAIDQWVSLRRT